MRLKVLNTALNTQVQSDKSISSKSTTTTTTVIIIIIIYTAPLTIKELSITMLAFLKSLDKTRSPERSDCATTVLTNSLRLVYAGDCS